MSTTTKSTTLTTKTPQSSINMFREFE